MHKTRQLNTFRQHFFFRLSSFSQQVKWKKGQEHSFHVAHPLQPPPQYGLFTCNSLKSGRKNSAKLQATVVVIQSDGRLAYRPRDTKTKERSRGVDVVAFKTAFSAPHIQTSHSWPQSTLTATGILRWLKTYLFMEAKKLTVAYPTVQHAIYVDVVGLWERVTHENMRRKTVKGLT